MVFSMAISALSAVLTGLLACKVRPILCACELRPIKVPPPNYQIYDNYCKEVFCTPESSLGVAIICALNRWQPSGGRFDVSKQTFNL